MKPKLPLFVLVVLIAIAIALAGCAKAPSDAQIASDVQSKIGADQAIANKQQLGAQAKDGVVTLSGVVASDAERNAAGADAAAAKGVRTVVNNLTVQPPQVAQTPAPAEQMQPPAPPAPPALKPSSATRQPRHEVRSSRENERSRPSAQVGNQNLASNTAPANMESNPVPPPIPPPVTQAPVVPVAPPPPPAPTKVTIPSGTNLSIRLNDGLDSERNRIGDTFRATLNAPVRIDDNTVIPADADVQGHVVDIQSAGRFAGAAKLAITLDRISYSGHSYQIETNQWSRESTGRGKNTAEKVGGGAILGAIIGGLAGGGKGAAIGATAGGGAGGGVQAATHGKQIKLAPEALVSFQLQAPVTVTPSTGARREALPNN